MKDYKENEDGSVTLLHEGSILSIKNTRHPSYQTMLSEISAGEATLTTFVDRVDELATINERAWRDGELKRADTELLKVQDGRGKGLTSDWRDYRNGLRDWPEHEYFPMESQRPVFISNKGGPT